MILDASSSADLKPHLTRVLIVDDNIQVIHDLCQLLELSGEIEIVGVVEGGMDAVRKTANLAPEVVIVDLEMPDLNGYETTAQIKAGLSNVRVVILSAHNESGDVERARAAGADAFVVKGADYQTLLNVILDKNVSTSSITKVKES